VRSLAFLRSPAGTMVRYLLSLGLLGWIIGRVDWSHVRGLSTINWGVAAPAMLLAGLAYPLQAWRWQILLRALGIRCPSSWVHGVVWIGQFYSSFLPGGVASDAVRLIYVWKADPHRRTQAAASLVADRLLGLLSLLALAALAMGMHEIVEERPAHLHLLTMSVLAFVVVFAGMWSLVHTRWWEPVSARLLGGERAMLLHDAVMALGVRRGPLARAAALSVAVWLIDFLSVWLLARAVGLQANPLEISVAAAAAYVAAILPVSIGGHGVREASLVSALALMGHATAGDGPMALLAVAFLMLSVGWSLFGGGVHLVSLITGWPVVRLVNPTKPRES
jgi:glycosyltransferase 2 family protein